MAHILFVDSSAVGLHAIATAQRLGHDVTLITPQEHSLLLLMRVSQEELMRRAGDAQVIAVPTMREPLTKAALAINGRKRIDAVLTTSELAVMPTAELAAMIGTRYDSPDALKRAVFKDTCRSVLRANDIPSTPFSIATDLESARQAANTIGYPVVIKPTRGLAKEASAILSAEADLDRFFADLALGKRRSQGVLTFLSPTFVIEKYISGALYSAEILAIDGVLHLMTIMRRGRAAHDQLIEVAAAMPSGFDPDEEREILRYFQRIFSAIGLQIGIYHVEFIMSPTGPILVEINARMMGGTAPTLYKNLTGIDPYRLLIELHLGSLKTFQTPTFTAGGVVIAVGTPEGGQLPSNARAIVDGILSEFQVVESRLRIENGAVLPKFAGNLSNLGSLVIRVDDAATVMEQAQALLTQLESGLGIPLAKIDLGR